MDFTSLFKYTDIRIEQLQKEEIIDKKLKDYIHLTRGDGDGPINL